MRALKKNWVLEIYGDAALDEGNQQGQYSLITEAGTNKVNRIGWKSKMSDRRAWSSLAAEAEAMQAVVDRPQEQSLRREIAIIREMVIYNNNRIRFIKSEVMLADHLTKERNGSQIYEVLKTNIFNRVNKYDSGEITTSMIRDAAIDIPLKELEKIHTVEVEPINEQITSIQMEGGQQQEGSNQSPRRQSSKRKATVRESDVRYGQSE